MSKLLFLLVVFCTQTFSYHNTPPKFSASVLRTTVTSDEEEEQIRRSIKLNPPTAAFVEVFENEKNENANVNFYFRKYGKFILIQNPVGPQLKPPGPSDFVLFSLFSEGEQSYCTYTTNIILGSSKQKPQIFPAHWYDGEILTVKSWFSFPRKMSYDGKKNYEGKNVDAWFSERQCILFDGAEELACRAIFLDENNFPVFYQIAHQSTETFDEEWLVIEEWKDFDPREPEISPPLNWDLDCYNIENGFVVQPTRALVSTATEYDNFTISLNTMPIADLGPIEVKFSITSTDCADCFTFVSSPTDSTALNHVEFTSKNWDIPKTIFIKYLKPGEGHFVPYSDTGSYSIKNWVNGEEENKTFGTPVRVITCEKGTMGYAC